MRRTVTHFIARGLLLITGLLTVTNAQAQFATVDWTIAETLVAIGAPISGVAQQQDYYDWVGEPHLPESSADLGLRAQPNFELLAQLAPEQILISPMFASLTPRLERIAPVTSLALYSPDADTWQEMQALTRELGELTDREAAAEQLIEDTQTLMASLHDAQPDTAPLLMVQFMDARHVRIFGENSLYNAVLEQLGLANAWDQPTNAWGFSLTGIEVLAGYPDARLVIIDPLPLGVEEQLATSGLWLQLPIVRNNNLLRLPPVWSFGALPSAQRFANVLSAALTNDS
ncbi:ABC transporter substrate-binding protein [Vreelandella populi]|uniref:Iron-siderophore ABC transporter substrate-binding protein n=1 Tax=Vreelandella populi TaxID=2498858 RepID=A0A3S0Z062_9GAMM|nr:ABC transporter substrate-binding protein [Halomonas populi]RUR35547.1 iron-siderophore ABC transporter substrate-binding protein [Halomonas populi]RUR47737.1 iron-siderophore ABC transporter substrate-binding protein [Halomonas populi]RUR54400.1 iron-siderophore ABC transporter substrate-binding protein [Halomonas populi]